MLKSNQPRRQPSWWVLVFCLIGFGLRLQALAFQPLWGDEGWSFYFAAQPLPQLLALTAIDIHPPLYYILLRSWFVIFGIGPETARFFSVVVGVLLIPVVGNLGLRLFNKKVGLCSGAVVALMPMAIYYSQEVRMYGLVTLLGALSSYFLITLTSDKRFSPSQRLAAYVCTTTLALYTMYYAAFMVLFQLLFSLLRLLPKLKSVTQARPRIAGKTTGHLVWIELRPFILVGLLYLPWLVYAGISTTQYVLNKRTVEAYVPLNFFQFFSQHFVTFSLGHLSPQLQPYGWVAIFFILVALVGLITSLYANTWPYLQLYLFLPLLAGYIVNLFFPFTPPYFERTWLVTAPAYWLLIGLGLAKLWTWQRVVAGLGTVLLLLMTTVGLLSFYSLPRYPQEDYRPLLRDIAARATPEDTLLASYQWQLGFYYAYLPPPRPQLFTVPGWGQGWVGVAGQPQRLQDLTALLQNSPRLWFPAHQALGHFWEDETEATLAELGYPALLQWYSPQTKLSLVGGSKPLLPSAPPVNFENRLELLTAKIGNEAVEAGRGITPVELTWQKINSLGSEHRVSLRLADAQGRTWAIRDTLPHAGQASFTQLATGQTMIDRHGLLIAAGTPPNTYRVLLSIRDTNTDRPLDLLDGQNQPQGTELLLGQVQVIDPAPAISPSALPVQFFSQADFGQAVRLIGYSLGDGPFKTGEILPLNLFWASLINAPGPLTTVIQLQDSARQPVFSFEQAPYRPSMEWSAGALLRDPYDLALPPILPAGNYQLVIALLNGEKNRLAVNGSNELTLAPVTIIERPHNFEPSRPQIELDINFSGQARLIGLDLPTQTVKIGATLPLTLHWQAQAPMQRSWTVFVHLVNGEDKIISQQDQIPGKGQFPTTGWLPTEYLLDPYQLTIPDNAQPGQIYWLKLGLYDAADLNFSRLPIVENGKPIGEYVILEKWPISVE